MAALDISKVSGSPTDDAVLEAFLNHLVETGVEPYGHQEEAILEIFAGKNVILNTPTGSGKSLVALAMQFRAVCQGRRSFYTVPVKALANEKFLSLCGVFGPEKVGMITGDATVNADAPVICCTAEILSNLALREGARAQVDDVIMDEFHYYSDHERGVAWQVPLLTLPQARFLLMSATLGETAFFEECLAGLTGAPVSLVKSDERPVPLVFDYSTTALEEKVEELVDAGRAPIYLVHFTQLSCARTAQNLMSRNFCSKEEKERIAEVLQDGDFRSPYGKEMKKLLRHGLGIHHAGLLPRYRVLVEKLAQQGLLKVICGTDTLGVGVNVPIRTVMLTQLFKYGGQSTKVLAVRDFKQICGRAGRKGFDDIGYVVAQAPEHVIDNLKAEEKAAAKGKKSKAQKKKPPEKGFVNWDENTFRKLIDSPPEKLSSAFSVNLSMMLNVLSRRDEDGCAELRRIISECHETPARKKELRRRAFALFKGLVQGRVLEIIPPERRTGAAKVALNVDLQQDFSLNQALGLYLLEAIDQLDMAAPEHALNVISLVEAILEDPVAVLRKQVDKLKGELIARLKDEGVEYEARMDALEEVTHPMPGKDFIYDTYNEFVRRNPWAKEASVRPKSVAREMFEDWLSFEDYVKGYGLERSEAVLLRHLSEVYKVLVQTVSPTAKTPDVEEAEAFLGAMVRGVDSSLIDEWEKLRDPEGALEKRVEVKETKVPFTRRKREFALAVRNAVLDFLKNLSRGEADDPQLAARLDEYYMGHGPIRMDPEARSAKHFRVEEVPGRREWRVEQVVVDPDDMNDWRVLFEVDLERSDAEERVVFGEIDFGPI